MKKVVINYSYFKLILNFITSIILISLGVYLLFEVNYKLTEYRTMMKDLLLFFIAISLIISYGKIFYKNLKNLNNKITLSELGIEVNGIFYNWNDISFPKMIVKKEFVGKNNLLHDFDYLSFNSQQKKIEVKIDDYQTNKEKLIGYLKISWINFLKFTTILIV